MIGTIIGAVVIGLLVGGLARLIMPGRQNIGAVMTVILGALGAFLEPGCPTNWGTPTRMADSRSFPS